MMYRLPSNLRNWPNVRVCKVKVDPLPSSLKLTEVGSAWYAHVQRLSRMKWSWWE